MFESLKKTPRFGVQSPFLQQVRGRLGKLVFRLLLVLVPLFLLRSCVITYVGPGEVGVRQIAYGPSKGLQKKPVSPGYRREIASYETVHTFPRDIQAVEFTNHPSERGATHRQRPAIKVPTVDGYPVDVDVTVLYRIKDPYKLASQFGFGSNADAYLVRRQQEAQATLAEKTAQAEGIRKERAALNSSAGDAYVNLQLIEALQKKEIRQIPKLPGGNMIIDGNRLLEQLGVMQYKQQVLDNTATEGQQ